MKYTVEDALCKEQMKYSPTLPIKTKGNTSNRNKVWIDQVQVDGLISGEQTRVQRDPENNFVNQAELNMNYDPTFDVDACRAGYIRKDLNPLENEYTGQHYVGMYETVTREDKETGDKVTGFLERNNYLDRI